MSAADRAYTHMNVDLTRTMHVGSTVDIGQFDKKRMMPLDHQRDFHPRPTEADNMYKRELVN